MKNAIILHGTLGSPKGNWFQWLKEELKNKGYKVWVPKLPTPGKPKISRNVKYVLSNKRWKFSSDSVLIGHSSAPLTILGILNELPDDIIVNKCIFVAPFTKSDWEPNSELFDYNFDFAKIRSKAKQFIVIHSDTDPYTPLDQPTNLAKKLGARLIIKNNEGHFNLEKGPQYKKFPFLLTLID